MEFKRNIQTRHEIRRKYKKKVFVRFGPRATRDFKIFANNSKTIIHAYYSDFIFSTLRQVTVNSFLGLTYIVCEPYDVVDNG